MRVNSSFTGFLNHRLLGSIAMLAILFTASSFTERSDRELRAKQVNVIMRQLGHQLLLQAGDSTSRVLPVAEITKGTFVLTFENDFVFNHDSLMMLTQNLFPKTQFPSGYTVTVHECLSAGIVYGFQINNTSPDLLACKGRSQPAGCYRIEVGFPDLYEDVAKIKTDNAQWSEELKLVKADLQEANLKFAALKSVKADVQEAKPIPPMAIGAIGTSAIKRTALGYPLINLVYGSGMLVALLGVTLLIGRFGKILSPRPPSDLHQPGERQNQNHLIIKESGSELSALGKFLFDVKDHRLLLGDEVISLTDKECRILELFHKNFGELIPRETLMQEVWINEGVITGRSLDMFVSKLRKKLSSDPELRITNVHGKGYKLEISGVQIL